MKTKSSFIHKLIAHYSSPLPSTKLTHGFSSSRGASKPTTTSAPIE